MTQTRTAPASRPALVAVGQSALIAGILAGLVNAGMFLVTAPQFQGVVAGPQSTSFNAGMFVVASIVGALGAGAVYALLGRFVARPNRVFAVVATVFLVLSFGSLLGVQGGGTVTRLVLGAAHAIVYVFVMLLVPRRAR